MNSIENSDTLLTRQLVVYALVKIANILETIMRQSNCSAPTLIPKGQARGQRKNVCDKKGRRTRKKGEISDYIGRGKESDTL